MLNAVDLSPEDLAYFEEVLQRGVSDESTFKLCLKVMEILVRKREIGKAHGQKDPEGRGTRNF